MRLRTREKTLTDPLQTTLVPLGTGAAGQNHRDQAQDWQKRAKTGAGPQGKEAVHRRVHSTMRCAALSRRGRPRQKADRRTSNYLLVCRDEGWTSGATGTIQANRLPGRLPTWWFRRSVPFE